MNNELTDRDLWAKYWENYQYKPLKRPPVYAKYLPAFKENTSFIEIGGFPGINASYIYKNCCKNVTILDFYVEPSIINRIEAQNGIPMGTIKYIENDFFTYKAGNQYDIVFSLGFIEHFIDTKDVLEKHVSFLKTNGTLLVLLPNLRGLNGMIQYLFDRKNLSIHNLESMEIKKLLCILKELGLKNIKVDYTRKPMVWLEPNPTFKNKIGRSLTKALSYFIKLFPVKCRLLSPYIVIVANK